MAQQSISQQIKLETPIVSLGSDNRLDEIELPSIEVGPNSGHKDLTTVDYHNTLFDVQFAPSVHIKVEPDIANICLVSPGGLTDKINMENNNWGCSTVSQLLESVQAVTMQTYDDSDNPELNSAQVEPQQSSYQNFSSYLPTTTESQFLCNICQHKSSLGQTDLVCTHYEVSPPLDLEKDSLFLLSSLTEGIESQTKNKQFCCNICQFKCFEKNNWKSHLLTHEEVKKTYSCNVCSYKCDKETDLATHMHTHKQFFCKKVKHSGEKAYSCNICQYKCSNLANLKSHKLTHTEVKKTFSCNICQYSSFRNADLIKHMRIHSGDKPYQCTVCEYSSTRRGNLETHMHKHTGQKPLYCTMCSYKTFEKPVMATHMRTHSDSTPFWCNKCDYKCSEIKSLKSHMRKVHPKEKKILYCDMCQYDTTRKEHLVRHKLAHSGVKPFWCDLCQYKSSRKEHLITHMRRHFGPKPFR